MKVIPSPFAGAVGFAVLSAGCLWHRPVSAPFDGCGIDDATRGYIIRTAANAIIGDRGAGGPRIRALAAVPLSVDSIHARSQVVSDRAICERLWQWLEPEERQSRVVALQIGGTYWVRVPGGTHAFDDRGHRLTAIVDLDL